MSYHHSCIYCIRATMNLRAATRDTDKPRVPCAAHRDPPPQFITQAEARAQLELDPQAKETNDMNDFQEKVFAYLTVPGHKERTHALHTLVAQNFFGSNRSEATTRDILTGLMNTWGSDGRFCDEGLNRAREHFGIKPKPKTHKIRVILDLDVEELRHIAPLVGRAHKSDGGLVEDLLPRLRDFANLNVKITEAAWLDYYVDPPAGFTSSFTRAGVLPKQEQPF